MAHHKPFLVVAGLSAETVDRIMDADLPAELDEVDRLVIAYTKIAWETPNRVTQRMHDALLEHFSEAQIVELTLRITLCGFFNRFNDALRIEEEEEQRRINEEEERRRKRAEEELRAREEEDRILKEKKDLD